MGGKEIQAAADQIVVAEGHVIHLRLQAQVAQPQPTVAFRPIFKHLLHAVFQGTNGNVINGFQLRIGDDRRVRAAGRGDGFQSDLIELQTKLARQRFDLHLQVAQAIATWQSDPGGQDVKPQILLLQPAAAQPSTVFAERLTDFAQRLAEGEVQMGRGIGRAADAAAAELQVANKMAAKINNDAVADVERLLIKLLRRADGIPRQPFSALVQRRPRRWPAASGAGVAARASGRPHAVKSAGDGSSPRWNCIELLVTYCVLSVRLGAA